MGQRRETQAVAPVVKAPGFGLDWWPQGGRRGEAGEMFRRLGGLDLKIDLFSGRATGQGM